MRRAPATGAPARGSLEVTPARSGPSGGAARRRRRRQLRPSRARREGAAEAGVRLVTSGVSSEGRRNSDVERCLPLSVFLHFAPESTTSKCPSSALTKSGVSPFSPPPFSTSAPAGDAGLRDLHIAVHRSGEQRRVDDAFRSGSAPAATRACTMLHVAVEHCAEEGRMQAIRPHLVQFRPSSDEASWQCQSLFMVREAWVVGWVADYRHETCPAYILWRERTGKQLSSRSGGKLDRDS